MKWPFLELGVDGNHGWCRRKKQCIYEAYAYPVLCHYGSRLTLEPSLLLPPGRTMIDPNDPLVQLKITCATCSIFALGTTMYRLYKRRGRLWADDAWALFAFVALIIQIASVFLHVPVPNNLSKTARVAAYYLMATTFYAIIWASRLSILFTVAFVATTFFLLAQLLWVCEPEPSWKEEPNPQCHLPLQVAICQLVTDVIADTILLFAPVPLFRHLANKPLRRKLTLIFSTCVVTTIVSLVHAAFILSNGGIKVVTALVQLTNDDEVTTVQTASLRFNAKPWFSAGQSLGVTTRGTGPITTVGLHTTCDDPNPRKHATSITWQTAGDDVVDREGTLVHKLSTIKASPTGSSSGYARLY
ncbi:hypothetical protein B0H15DRAFT_140509 [Mycena belliarum]|uniref:Integral membrane protein n=1 Tax=Mycena belliarum TaxID=1033014 RepID=A0AAD6XHW9_9AGAR|nr:hypothetical protein B0H15DRAFT_140509 [Mycena belliae]